MARLVTAQEVLDKDFKSKRNGRWYDADEVDEFLDQVYETLTAFETDQVRPFLIRNEVQHRDNPFMK